MALPAPLAEGSPNARHRGRPARRRHYACFDSTAPVNNRVRLRGGCGVRRVGRTGGFCRRGVVLFSAVPSLVRVAWSTTASVVNMADSGIPRETTLTKSSMRPRSRGGRSASPSRDTLARVVRGDDTDDGRVFDCRFVSLLSRRSLANQQDAWLALIDESFSATDDCGPRH